ncbi:MAG: transporter substrate-binding domain-containing protein [Candidatus Omnitrophica bacterium]|nr:transporter substrate-binding domain-containing protein [Candidatus Omnitrophota bacterium]
MLKRFFFAVITAFILNAALTAPGNTAPVSSREKGLVFAGASEFAPYSFMSEGSPAGYCVDLIKVISADLNTDIRITILPWDKCLVKARSGKVDGIIGVPVYDKRGEYLSFSEPVSTIEYAIFVEASNNFVNSLSSLGGTLVAVPEDSMIIDRLNEEEHIQTVETGSVSEALRKLAAQEVVAVVAEKNVALYYMHRNRMDGIKIAGPPVGPLVDYSIGVAKNTEHLLPAFDRSINKLKANNTLQKLQRKWLGLRITSPFPWKMVIFTTSAITLVMLFLAGALWLISLNATIKAKTHQIKMMSRKMVEKDKLAVLGKLAGQIAHELRTPLSIINNSIFLLRKEGAEDHALFEKRLRILEEKIRLSSNILESILSYSRIKAEMATTISIKECLTEVLNDIEIPEGIETDVSFEDPEHQMVFMDFHQLYSVFRNIILNALQVMGETGRLSVKASPSDDDTMVNILISDTGGGIEKSIRQKMFNLFYSTKITGTGLGLPISKSIIETNGGELILERTGEKGTCFRISIPSASQ